MSKHSPDRDNYRVPDDREESGMFGGESTMGGSEQSPVEEEAAWEAFYEWSFSQYWSPQCELTTSEQLAAYVNKLTELGMTMP